MREDTLIDGVTRFFNTHVLGPDRLSLAQESMPAANDFVRSDHIRVEAEIRKELVSIDDSMNNLMRALERESDPEGQLYKRTKKRMTELEMDYTATETRLHRHIAATPPEQEGNVGLLEHLPLMEVDLNLLPADRLRRFLEAFRVEIHYDLRTGRATFKAEISAETVNQLAQQASRADAALWQAATATDHVRVASNEEVSAEPGGYQMIKGRSFGKCPRREPSNMGTAHVRRRACRHHCGLAAESCLTCPDRSELCLRPVCIRFRLRMADRSCGDKALGTR